MKRYVQIAWQEIRGSKNKLWVYISCVLMCLTLTTVVEIGSNCIYDSLNRNAKGLLAGDAELSTSNFQFGNKQIKSILELGEISLSIETRAMMKFDNQFKLIEVKAVDDLYPIYGKLILGNSEYYPGMLSDHEALIDASMAKKMNLELGQKIQIAAQKFTIAGFITKEDDRITNYFLLGPRVIISSQGLKNSGLLQPGSLIQYRYKIKLHNPADLNQLGSLVQGMQKELPITYYQYNKGNNLIEKAFSKIDPFLRLANLMNIMLIGIGIFSAVHYFMTDKLSNIVIMKTLGASPRFIIGVYGTLFAMVSICCMFMAFVAAHFISIVVIDYVQKLVPFTLEYRFMITPYLRSFAYSGFIISAFCIGPIMSAADSSASGSLKEATKIILPIDRKTRRYIAALLLLALSVLLHCTTDAFLTIGFCLGTSISLALILAISSWLKKRLSMLPTNGFILKMALHEITGRNSTCITIITVISLTLSLITMVHNVKGNINNKLSSMIKIDSPSLFITDLIADQPQQLIQNLKDKAGVTEIISHPFISARITHIKGIPVEKAIIDESVAWAVRSDRKVSYSAEQPADAVLESGKWWVNDYNGAPLISLDAKVAKGMAIEIGDSMTFNINGSTIIATVHNLRAVDYSNLRIKFAIMFSPNVLEAMPHGYFAIVSTADYANVDDLIETISQSFGNATVINVKEAVGNVQNIIAQIITAIGYVNKFSLVSGLLVLIGALMATLQEKIYRFIILRVLGASYLHMIAITFLEITIVCSISGILGLLLGTISSNLLLSYLKIEVASNFWMHNSLLIMIITVGVSMVYMLINRQIWRSQLFTALRN